MDKAQLIDPMLEAPADALGLAHRGLNYGRAARCGGPAARREQQFAQAWQRENLRDAGLTGVLDALLRGQDEAGLSAREAPRPVPMDQNAATVAATTVQWMGTTQGFKFLADVLEAAGYKLVDAATGTVQTAGTRFERRKREAIRERYLIDAAPVFSESGPTQYCGTVDGTTMSSGATHVERAIHDAISALLDGSVVEQLAVRLAACASGHVGRQASPEQITRYAERCAALAGKVLADLDVRASEANRERLRRALAEWRRGHPLQEAEAAPARKVA
jgi:hypothetical protein